MRNTDKNKKTPLSKHFILGLILAGAFLASAVVLIVFCFLLGMIPTTYILIFAIVIVAVTEGILFANKWKVSGIIVNVISCLLILCFAAGSFYVNITRQTVQAIQSGDTTTIYIGVYVMDDDDAQELADTTGYTFGYDSLYDEYATSEAITYIETALSQTLTLEEYDSMFTMLDELSDGDTDVIIISESYLSIAEDIDDYDWVEDDLRQIERIAVTVEKDTADEEGEEETLEADIDLGTFVVYISGIDEYGEVSVTSRSDVNILAIVNTETKTVALISTPRDYYVTFEATNGAYDKLTHAGLYGIDQSEDALETLYGVSIDYYIRMNFTGFEEIIDALGGITVYSECSFSSSVSDYTYVQGYNTLTGEAALYFARERKAFTSGDFQRGRNQMAVIEAVIDKLASFTTLAKFETIMDAIGESFETDMPTSIINALVQMQLTDGSSWSVETYQTTGNSGNAITYSASGQYLSVVFQDVDSINGAIELINKTLYPELFEDEEESSDESDELSSDETASDASSSGTDGS